MNSHSSPSPKEENSNMDKEEANQFKHMCEIVDAMIEDTRQIRETLQRQEHQREETEAETAAEDGEPQRQKSAR